MSRYHADDDELVKWRRLRRCFGHMITFDSLSQSEMPAHISRAACAPQYSAINAERPNFAAQRDILAMPLLACSRMNAGFHARLILPTLYCLFHTARQRAAIPASINAAEEDHYRRVVPLVGNTYRLLQSFRRRR